MEMERQQLPNSTLILIFGILSIVGCCCYGLVGLVFGIIALVLANKASKMYAENPDMYIGYQNVKSGRIMAIIGVALSVIYIILIIAALIIYGGVEGIMELQREIQEQYGG